MQRLYKDDPKSKRKALTASEIRQLPKAEREKILEAQYKAGAKLYASDPDSIVQASHRVHD